MSSLPASLAFEQQVAGSWDARPFQLVTLLDMIRFEVLNLYIALQGIEELRIRIEDLQKERGNTGVLTPQESKAMSLQLAWLFEACRRTELTEATSRLRTFRNFDGPQAQNPEIFPLETVKWNFKELIEAVYRDLHTKTFLFMPQDHAVYYERGQAFGALVDRHFTSARNDIQEAANCYATGRYTACAFHCARVAEKGLHALAHDMNRRFGVVVSFGDKKIERVNLGISHR